MLQNIDPVWTMMIVFAIFLIKSFERRMLHLTSNDRVYLPTYRRWQWKVASQCDQSEQFIGLWATFLSIWQQLICPNLPHS